MARMIMGPVDEASALSEANGFRSREQAVLRAADEDRDELLGIDPIERYAANTVVILIDGEYEPVTSSHLSAPAAPGPGMKLAVVLRGSDPGDAPVLVRDAEVKGKSLVFVASAGGSATAASVQPFFDFHGVIVR